MKIILSDLLYAIFFYFFIFTPFFLFLLSPATKSVLKEISGKERGFFESLLYSWAFSSVFSLFGASLSYLLINSPADLYYISAHFFVIVPLLGFLISLFLAKLNDKKWFSYASTSTLLLNVFSMFIGLIYMGMKVHIGQL